MASNVTTPQFDAIHTALSATRMATYIHAAGFTPEADALEKYTWNALVASAFFSSIHICEVTVRNAIASALENVYGADWPWNQTFLYSLPSPKGSHFNPKNELERARSKFPQGATGKVIAELKFAFWCHLCTRRYDGRLWTSHISAAFPHLPLTQLSSDARLAIFTILDDLRACRNRIAHHEPIFAGPLAAHHQHIQELIGWRSGDVSHWLAGWETVTHALSVKP